MQLPLTPAVILFIFILIQAVLLPYRLKSMSSDEKEIYERTQKLYLAIIEVILSIGFIFAALISRNSSLVYMLGSLLLAVTFYEAVSSIIKTRIIDINERAKTLILISKIIYVLFAIVFVGSLIYQQN